MFFEKKRAEEGPVSERAESFEGREEYDPRFFSTPEMAKRFGVMKKENMGFPYHQKSETQKSLAEKYGLPENASVSDVLDAEDRAWRRGMSRVATREESEAHLREVVSLHKKIVAERGFPPDASMLDVISAEKIAEGRVMYGGEWITKEELREREGEAQKVKADYRGAGGKKETKAERKDREGQEKRWRREE